MAKKLYEEASVSNIANAIRAKGGSGTFTIGEMAQAIEDLPSGESGSDRWKRPKDWPDYNKLDISQEEAWYMTYAAHQPNSYATFRVNSPSGQTHTVQVGTLTNGVFTELDTDTFAGNHDYMKPLFDYAQDYVVIRVTGNVTKVSTEDGADYNLDGHIRPKGSQSLLEVYARMPGITSLSFAIRNCLFVKSFTAIDMAGVTDMTRIAGDCRQLENVFISGVVNRISAYHAFAQAPVYYLYLNGMKLNDIRNAFNNCLLGEHDLATADVEMHGTDLNNAFANCRSMESLDMSGWNIPLTGAISMFTGCAALRDVDCAGVVITGSARAMFQGTSITKLPTLDYSGITEVNNMFNSTLITGDITMPESAATSFGTMFQYCRSVRSITIPATYTGQIVAQAFRDTNSLEEIHFLATTPPPLANANAFAYGGGNANRKIYVPYSADHSVLAAYQAASNWSALTNLVEEPAP